jgi:hypothetical protein
MKKIVITFIGLATAIITGFILNIIYSSFKGLNPVFASILAFSIIFVPMIVMIYSIDFVDSKVDSLKKKYTGRKETLKNKKIVEADLLEYHSTKNSIRYISNEQLKEIYEKLVTSKTEDMKRLAVEEELVDRKLIPFSPMHEKLQKLQQFFNSK